MNVISNIIFPTNGNRIGVKFPYDEKVVSMLKTIPQHKWHPDKKIWSFPSDATIYAKLLKIFDGREIKIVTELKSRFEGIETKRELPKSELITSQLNQKVVDGLTELMRLMRLKNYSGKTIKSYTSCIRALFQFYNDRKPRELSANEIKSFLLNLIEEKNCSSGTINQYINGIRFLYVKVYKVPFVIGEIPRPRKETKLPDVFNDEEVLRLFNSVKNLKHRVMLMITYASGLRVSELVNLQIEDIDIRRRTIHIRSAKGHRDRCIPLAEMIIKPLHIYWQAYNLGVKGWLFPGSKSGDHLSVRSIQAVFERAIVATGITKPVSMHTLRHSYATHSAEHGYDIRHLQKVLGHKSIKTTEIYTHISNTEIAKVKSPLDFLLKDYILDDDSKEIKLLKK